MEKDLKEKIKELAELMAEVVEDRGVPRNIRTVIDEAMQKIEGKDANAMGFSSAIYQLGDISNDINMPHHTRTDIWEIISKLEAIKEQMK